MKNKGGLGLFQISQKPEHGFYTGSNPARGVSEIRDGEDPWQWSRLEMTLRLSSVNHTTKTIHRHPRSFNDNFLNYHWTTQEGHHLPIN